MTEVFDNPLDGDIIAWLEGRATTGPQDVVRT